MTANIADDRGPIIAYADRKRQFDASDLIARAH